MDSKQITKTSVGGLEVTEFTGEAAAEAISDFAGLSLVPLERDEWNAKLARAGFIQTQKSLRSLVREDQRADLDR